MILRANSKDTLRNSLTADEIKLLEEYWCNGLQSYGSSLNKKKILELTKQTSLSARRIKNWIDNTKTKQVRRKFGSRSKVPSLKPRKRVPIAASWQSIFQNMVATSPENQGATLNKANKAWKKVKGTPEVSRYKEQADNKNRMEAEGTTIRQEHEKVMARHILTEIKKMRVMLMVLLKKQPVQHYVPACRSSLTKNTLAFGQWMQLNPRNTKLCGMQVRAEEQ
ncbi:uncharacterized protein [Apostichopus japonicus]|uniref:uncharacterized protein n=1 Tax=Stichopus japonicus TaxID=307972 RepID=UPI003AB33F9C